MSRGDPAEARIGTVLGGRWRLERLVGEGGMGAVFEARHVRNGKRAAIKVLHALPDRTGALFARFQREARISTLLEGEGVVTVFDDDVDKSGAPYIVMELLRGRTFAELADAAGGRLPVDQVVAMARAVLAVLEKAHARGVVHRDLKPANVFRTDDGAIKVLDFGIAGLGQTGDEEITALTAPSTPMLGSIGFMPPEQARGDWENLDARSDLWALGATMFTLLTGRSVHSATSARKELVRSMLDAAPPLASLAPQVPHDVCRVVDRALAFDRDGRWPDAASMLADLEVTADPELASTIRASVVSHPAGLEQVPPRTAPARTQSAVDMFDEATTNAPPEPQTTPVDRAAHTAPPARPRPGRVVLLALALLAALIGAALFLSRPSLPVVSSPRSDAPPGPPGDPPGGPPDDSAAAPRAEPQVTAVEALPDATAQALSALPPSPSAPLRVPLEPIRGASAPAAAGSLTAPRPSPPGSSPPGAPDLDRRK